jgi:chitinase
LLFVVFLYSSFGQQWSIGHWAQFGTPIPISAIPWDGLTHVIHGPVLVNSDGTLDTNSFRFSANASNLVAAAHAANVKAMILFQQPYWLGHTSNFQQAVTSHREALVNNIMNLVNTYGFDGVDIDWEPFDPAKDGAAMKSLLTSLRAQLGTRILTADAIGNTYSYWNTVAAQLDRINVMTYDMGGLWDPYSWHNAALYSNSSLVWSTDFAIRRFLGTGILAEKLTMGIPFYGVQWKGGGISGPYQNWNSTPSMNQVDYNKIVPQINAQNYHWDSTAQVPYLSNNAGIPSYLSYDDEQSIAAKVNYAKTMGLGGWAIWHISLDYFPQGSPQHPLMAAIRNAMNVAPSITTPPSLPAANAGQSYSYSLTATGAPPITWTLTGGALPVGLALSSSSGVISGTPSSVGTSIFTVQASNPAGSATRQFTLQVNVTTAVPVIISTSPLPEASLGSSYSQQLTATSTSPITWTLRAGELPLGLGLESSTGIISGTPSSAGTFIFTVQARNIAGSATRQFKLNVSQASNLLRSPNDIIHSAWGFVGEGAYKLNPTTVSIGSNGTASLFQNVRVVPNRNYTVSVTLARTAGSSGSAVLNMYTPKYAKVAKSAAIIVGSSPQTISYTFNSGARTKIIWEVDFFGGTASTVKVTGATLR